MAMIDTGILLTCLTIGTPEQGKIGTAFVISRPDEMQKLGTQENDPSYYEREWFVTAAHVIDAVENAETILVNMRNASTGKTEPMHYAAGRNRAWIKHSRWRPERTGNTNNHFYDVAIAPAPTHVYREGGITWRTFRKNWLVNKQQLQASGLAEGTGTYIIGFPAGGLYREGWTWPVLRAGTVAQIQPWYNEETPGILVETSGSGGNSGGPVVTRPETHSIEGPPHSEMKLLGVYVGQQVWGDTDIDLSLVVLMERVHEVIELALHAGAHGAPVVFRNGKRIMIQKPEGAE